MKLHFICAALIFVGFSPAAAAGPAATPPPHGVLSGVIPLFVLKDTLEITSGSIWVDGHQISVAGFSATIPGIGGTLPQFCQTTDAVLKGYVADSYYYMYYVDDSAGQQGFYVTATPPYPDGHPSVALHGSGGPGGNCGAAATTHALFVGSFLTDAAINIVPFFRNYDQVILSQNGGPFHSPISFSRFHTPLAYCVVMPSILTMRIPKSASGLLVTLSNPTTTCGAPTQNVELCLPGAAITNAVQMTSTECGSYQDQFLFPESSAAQAPFELRQYRIPLDALNPPLFCSTGPAGTCTGDYIDVDLTVTAYVERIPHPVP